jgi:hypothetical protein
VTDLAEFLLARITEQEHRVCSASALNGPVWTAANGFINGSTDTNANPRAYNGDTELWDDEGALSMHPATAEFIAANDPRHVLAECEAKRRIVEMHGFYQVQTANDGLDWDYVRCGICDIADLAPGEGNWPCPTLRALALPYAYHSDYREEWRP